MRHTKSGLWRGALSMVMAAMLAGMAGPSLAEIRAQAVGITKGRPPVPLGTVGIFNPDGVALVNNYQVLHTKKPGDFTANLSLLTGDDRDGDTGTGPGGLPAIAPRPATEHVWTWKRSNGTALTVTERAQTFQTSGFADGAVLTVQASIPMESTTTTGNPWTGVRAFATPTMTVVVKAPPPPVIRVNGHTFAWNSGFPTTGFIGARFQLYMNGVDATANSNYTYRENGNQTWVDIPTSNASGTEGTFTFTGTPTSANKTLRIIATNKTDSNDKHTLNITLGRWFVNGGKPRRTAANADAYCTGLGGGYSTPPYETMTNATYKQNPPSRAPTSSLWSQWGNLGAFGNGWDGLSYYWAQESRDTMRYILILPSGALDEFNTVNAIDFACSRVL